MGAFRAHGVGAAVEVEDQDLAALDALDVAFEFLLGFEGGEGGEVFEFVFLHFGEQGG